MVTVNRVKDNAVVAVFENPTTDELKLIKQLEEQDAVQQSNRAYWGDFEGVKEPDPVQLSLEDYGKNGWHHMTDEELLECPFGNITDEEREQARKRIEEKKKNAPKPVGNGSYHGKTVEELRKANEGIVW